MKKVFIIFIILSTFTSQAQTTSMQWASKVLEFSSERINTINQSPQHRAIQVLGSPNKLVQTGSNVCAWSPSGADNYDKPSYIKVGFMNPIKTRQISIAASFTSHTVVKILAYDSTDNEYLISQSKEYSTIEKGKIWNIILPQTTYKVYAIKIIINPSKVFGNNQIDAIGISESELPYELEINLVKNIPSKLSKENLGKGVNSKTTEIAPIITPDGKTLFFTRGGHPLNIGKYKAQDIWVSRLLLNDKWDEAQIIKKPINTDENNAVLTISADGQTLYLVNLYMSDGTYRSGLSKSVKGKSGWGFPKEVKIEDYYNESPFIESSLGSNGKTLVMACQRKDSFGGKDLYVSFLKNDTIWSNPINMGHALNTAENEISPFIAADSKTLYFSTGGFAGFGDNDIFVSHRLDSTWTNWSEPENLGNLINTAKWDGYFTIPASGEYAYLASEEKTIGKEDIFRIKLFPSIKPEPVALVSGIILNEFDKNPLDSKVVIELFDKSINEKIIGESNAETGIYTIIVPLGKSYELNIIKDGFLAVKELIDLTKESSYVEIKKNINLIPTK